MPQTNSPLSNGNPAASNSDESPWFERILGPEEQHLFSTPADTEGPLWHEVLGPLVIFSVWPVSLYVLGSVPEGAAGLVTLIGFVALGLGGALLPIARRIKKNRGSNSPIYRWVGSGAILLFPIGLACLPIGLIGLILYW